MLARCRKLHHHHHHHHRHWYHLNYHSSSHLICTLTHASGPGGLHTILDMPEPIITDVQPTMLRNTSQTRRSGSVSPITSWTCTLCACHCLRLTALNGLVEIQDLCTSSLFSVCDPIVSTNILLCVLYLGDTVIRKKNVKTLGFHPVLFWLCKFICCDALWK